MADGSFLTQQGEEESTPCVPPIGGSLQAARDAARDALSLEYDDPDEPLSTAPARLSSWKTQVEKMSIGDLNFDMDAVMGAFTTDTTPEDMMAQFLAEVTTPPNVAVINKSTR